MMSPGESLLAIEELEATIPSHRDSDTEFADFCSRVDDVTRDLGFQLQEALEQPLRFSSFNPHIMDSKGLTSILANWGRRVWAKTGDVKSSIAARSAPVVGPIKLDRRYQVTQLRKRLLVLHKRAKLLASDLAELRPITVAQTPLVKAAHAESSKRLLVIARAYPSPSSLYAGAFVHRRIVAYKRLGWSVSVYCVGNYATSSWSFEGVRVQAGDIDSLFNWFNKAAWTALFVHSPDPHLATLVHKMSVHLPVVVWFHGFEVRDYSRLLDNFGLLELKLAGKSLERLHFARMHAARELFRNDRIVKIFVSKYLRDIARSDVGVSAVNTHVIPNPVDPITFKYYQKGGGDRKKILMVRPFTRFNYGADLGVATIERLASDTSFSDCLFHVQGFGPGIKTCAKHLSKFPNVKVVEGALHQAALSKLFQQYGVILCPSRHDTQGVLMCEAMASGLVPVTHAVGGIPEFVDASCGILCAPTSVEDMVKGVSALVRDPHLFLRMSRRAADRASTKCGLANTINKELDILGHDF